MYIFSCVPNSFFLNKKTTQRGVGLFYSPLVSTMTTICAQWMFPRTSVDGVGCSYTFARPVPDRCRSLDAGFCLDELFMGYLRRTSR